MHSAQPLRTSALRSPRFAVELAALALLSHGRIDLLLRDDRGRHPLGVFGEAEHPFRGVDRGREDFLDVLRHVVLRE